MRPGAKNPAIRRLNLLVAPTLMQEWLQVNAYDILFNSLNGAG
jgi:hypothetical protein